MCRLFAMSGGPQTVGATFWLLDAERSLVRQSEQNADGTGLGWFDEDGHAHLDKLPIAGYVDTAFAADARRVRARTILAHVRYATSTPHTIANTHPFLLDGRLFGHNGVVGDLAKVEERIGADVRHQLAGDTDSERFFALVTHEIAQAGGDERAGITAAVRWLAEEIELYSLNFVMATATDLWALRYPAANTLYLLKRRSTDPSPTGHPFAKTADSQGIGVSAPDTANQSAVIIASEPLNADDWQELPPGELIHVGPDLEIDRDLILESDPQHLMVLSGQAAAAQAAD